MTYKSITKRWIFNSLAVIVVALIVLNIAICTAIQWYYYASVESIITYSAENGYNLMKNLSSETTANINSNLLIYIQNFDEKDKIEVMGINRWGSVTVTSSGFSKIYVDDMPDYLEAIESEEGIGYYTGVQSSTGEKIMAVTVELPLINGDFAAIRYVVSLKQVDSVIFTFMSLVTGVMVLILACILISSAYFLKSIVTPVKELGDVAREFAVGNLSTRIIKKTNDEIGELCDIINYMADEMQNSEKIKNEFISSVSHELRTPLTAIKGWSETLMTMGPEDSDMIKQGMRVITSETERLSNMVEELLDFSRMQDGKFKLVKTKMDILAELGDAVLIYTERARRDNKELIYDEPENVSYIFGDKNRLKQVFINIIDNALKYSESGDKVSVRIWEETGFVYVSISDTGCGISSEDLPKVKEKFYKANSTKRGSGIGLAVASEIVSLHDGDLTVQSELGVGTTVDIIFPIITKEENIQL